jgi:hypothetical protein
MGEYMLKLGSEGYRRGGIYSSTGLTLKRIESIVANCEFIKSAWDMETLNKQTVYSKSSLKFAKIKDVF